VKSMMKSNFGLICVYGCAAEQIRIHAIEVLAVSVVVIQTALGIMVITLVVATLIVVSVVQIAVILILAQIAVTSKIAAIAVTSKIAVMISNVIVILIARYVEMMIKNGTFRI